MRKRFQPGEGFGRGLLRDWKTLRNLQKPSFEALSRPGLAPGSEQERGRGSITQVLARRTVPVLSKHCDVHSTIATSLILATLVAVTAIILQMHEDRRAPASGKNGKY